jgi:DMSO reductase anchor subunit
MVKSEEHWPLVGFTALSPIAIGGLAGLLFVRGSSSMGVDWGAIALLGIALLALIASSLDLGHPFRSYRAIARFSTSWLSREVVLFSLFVFLLAAYAMPIRAAGGDGGRGLVGVLAAVVGALCLWATSRVYHLPSRPAWNHWRTMASLFLGALGAGLPVGAFVGRFGMPGGADGLAGITSISAVALLLGAGITCLRARRPDQAKVEEFAAWQVVVGPCRWLLALRVAGALCALVLLLAPGPLWMIAWAPATIGEIADRALFFQAVVPVSMTMRMGITPFKPVQVVASPTPRPRGE